MLYKDLFTYGLRSLTECLTRAVLLAQPDNLQQFFQEYLAEQTEYIRSPEGDVVDSIFQCEKQREKRFFRNMKKTKITGLTPVPEDASSDMYEQPSSSGSFLDFLPSYEEEDKKMEEELGGDDVSDMTTEIEQEDEESTSLCATVTIPEDTEEVMEIVEVVEGDGTITMIAAVAEGQLTVVPQPEGATAEVLERVVDAQLAQEAEAEEAELEILTEKTTEGATAAVEGLTQEEAELRDTEMLVPEEERSVAEGVEGAVKEEGDAATEREETMEGEQDATTTTEVAVKEEEEEVEIKQEESPEAEGRQEEEESKQMPQVKTEEGEEEVLKQEEQELPETKPDISVPGKAKKKTAAKTAGPETSKTKATRTGVNGTGPDKTKTQPSKSKATDGTKTQPSKPKSAGTIPKSTGTDGTKAQPSKPGKPGAADRTKTQATKARAPERSRLKPAKAKTVKRKVAPPKEKEEWVNVNKVPQKKRVLWSELNRAKPDPIPLFYNVPADRVPQPNNAGFP